MRIILTELQLADPGIEHPAGVVIEGMFYVRSRRISFESASLTNYTEALFLMEAVAKGMSFAKFEFNIAETD